MSDGGTTPNPMEGGVMRRILAMLAGTATLAGLVLVGMLSLNAGAAPVTPSRTVAGSTGDCTKAQRDDGGWCTYAFTAAEKTALGGAPNSVVLTGTKPQYGARVAASVMLDGTSITADGFRFRVRDQFAYPFRGTASGPVTNDRGSLPCSSYTPGGVNCVLSADFVATSTVAAS